MTDWKILCKKTTDRNQTLAQWNNPPRCLGLNEAFPTALHVYALHMIPETLACSQMQEIHYCLITTISVEDCSCNYQSGDLI
jgi:hypothetical protein